MKWKCTDQFCKIAEGGKCVLGKSHNECPRIEQVREMQTARGVVHWSGMPIPDWKAEQDFRIDHVNTKIIGLIGYRGTGKSTMLGLYYCMLRNGQSSNIWKFSGSKTLLSWNILSKNLKYEPGNFPARMTNRTSHSEDLKLLHLAFRSQATFLPNLTKNILIPDVAGEVYEEWAKDTDGKNSQQAKWIAKNSSAVIFMLDCEFLANTPPPFLKLDNLFSRVRDYFGNRPIAFLWTKSDNYPNIPEETLSHISNWLRVHFAKHKQYHCSILSPNNEINHLNSLQNLFDTLISDNLNHTMP